MPCFNLKTKKKGCGVNYERGQSLIELVVAIGIFVIVISVLVFLILNSYISGRLASEITQANFLAEEGLETARSIRDNSWDDLSNGIHYLDDSTGNWRFTDQPEIIDEKFERVINVEEIDPDNPDPDRKKVTSQVTWQFTEARPQEVSLVTYLTNWQKVAILPGLEIRRPTAHTDRAGRTTDPELAYDSPNGATWTTTGYNTTRDPSITFHTWQTTAETYTSLILKYRYHADEATNDTYAVAYSLTSCEGIFIDLISPTSVEASDTTISVDLPPEQVLSDLCLKISTTKTAAPDNRDLYTRDIWTEGTF